MELIPKQKKGNKTDNIEIVNCKNVPTAKKKYTSASQKLFAIDKWGDIGSMILQTNFTLCNNSGAEILGPPQIGHFIKINLLGPGSISGEGFDWVQIEKIEIGNEKNDIEFSSIIVRPVMCPLNETPNIAHFFNDAATSTFIVTRKGNKVMAEIHGRNEIPNKTTTNKADNIRNIIVAKMAAVKLSDIQWQSLCKGLLA